MPRSIRGRAASAIVVGGLTAISLAGCGGASSGGSANSGNSAVNAAQNQANAIQSAMAGTESGAAVTPTPTYTDDQACAMLKTEAAALKSITGMGGVQIHLLTTLGAFEDKYDTNGEQINAAAERACPDVLKPILKKAQISNLGDL